MEKFIMGREVVGHRNHSADLREASPILSTEEWRRYTILRFLLESGICDLAHLLSWPLSNA
jgi:hypothetical protein